MCERRIALTFALDRSGSMSGQQANVRAFANSVLAQLDIGANHSRAALVMFNNVGLVAQSMSASRADLIASVAQYGTTYPVMSGTNINAGLNLAKTELDQARSYA